jgi:DNA helicase-2/ATP-dependent DNA helicase PcrA
VFQNTKLVTLEQNYRSTQQVLDVANQVMGQAARSYTKILKAISPPGERPWLVRPESATQQAEFITAKILELREEGIPLGEMAVLCRAVWHLRELELELGRCNIPYVVFGGIKFAEAAHVKDLLAFLKVAVNPRDDIALKRILELLPGIGPSRSDKIIAAAASAESPWRALSSPDIKIPAGTAAKLNGMATLLKAIAGDGKKPAESVEAAKRFYRPLLREKFDDHPSREPDCDLMINLASPYRSLHSFLADMSLEPSRDRYQKHVEPKDNEDEALVLSTVHSAKGLEFHSVFIPHLVDGLFPSSRAFDDPEALEEERRIFYVATTRAKEGLYLCQPVFVAAPYLKNSGISKISRFVDQTVARQIDEVDIEWD